MFVVLRNIFVLYTVTFSIYYYYIFTLLSPLKINHNMHHMQHEESSSENAEYSTATRGRKYRKPQTLEKVFGPLFNAVGSAKDFFNAGDLAEKYSDEILYDDDYFELWAKQQGYFLLPDDKFGDYGKMVDGKKIRVPKDQVIERFETHKKCYPRYKQQLEARDVSRISKTRKIGAAIGAAIAALLVSVAYSRLGNEARKANKKLKEKQASYEKRLASYEKQLENALKSANDANASAMDAMKKADEQRIDDLKEKIGKLKTKIKRKEERITELDTEQKQTLTKLRESKSNEGISGTLRNMDDQVRRKFKSLWKDTQSTYRDTKTGTKKGINQLMQYFTRKRSPPKGKPKKTANKPTNSTAMTAKNH